MDNKILLLSILVMLVCKPPIVGAASKWVIPASEWTVETHLWTARALTAEAGWNRSWRQQREQIAIAYVLVKRYATRKQGNHKEHFVDSVRAYCNGMKKTRRHYTKRMRWLRALPIPNSVILGNTERIQYPIVKPKFWPKNLHWNKYQKYYGQTWSMLHKWVRGQYMNPCPGAIHWGARTDVTSSALKLHKCSKNFGNAFYKLR